MTFYWDWLVSILIYLVALAITLQYALRHDFEKEWTDRHYEYEVYRGLIAEGWKYVVKRGVEVVPSCLTILFSPYLIYLLIRCNPLTLFKVFPCFCYSLMPTFTYLIARQFLDIPYSIIASALLLSSFFFLYYPDTGRVGAAQGFLSVMLYAIFTGHPVIASIFAVLVVLSHYGTAYLIMFAMIGAWVFLFLKDSHSVDFHCFSVALSVIISGNLIWHNLIMTSGKVCNKFIKQSFTFEELASGEPSSILPGLPDCAPRSTSKLSNFFKLEYRDRAIQVAFGKTLQCMNIPQKIELVLSWAIVLSLSAGFVFIIYRLGLSAYTAMVCGMFLTIIVAVIIPHISAWYGFIRIYFTALIVLAPCFAIGIDKLAGVAHLNGYVLGASLVILYALCVSGIMHRIFGIDKRQLQSARLSPVASAEIITHTHQTTQDR